MPAKRYDWKTTPLPAARASIGLDRTYSSDEFSRIKKGHVPAEMEDKWFAFYEEPWLHIHRSWTGNEIYQVRFEPADGGARVAESLVSRDPEQHSETADNSDALFLAYLVDGYAGRNTEAAWERYRESKR